MWARKLHNPCISTIRALRRFILPDSIKNDRFKALTDRLQEKVKQPGEWYGLQNALSAKVMIHHLTIRRIEMCCIRNCSQTHWNAKYRRINQDFILLNGLSTNPASLYAISSIVRLKIYISVGQAQWQHNFDDLFVTSLLLNTRNTWLSLNYDERKTMTCSACLLLILYNKE